MPSDLVINVRQISNYPSLLASDGTEMLLVQQGGLGGPYATLETQRLVASALHNSGPLGVGATPPADAAAPQVFAAALNLPATAQILWDAYINTQNQEFSWSGAQSGSYGFTPPLGWNWATAPVTPDQPLQWFNLMTLSPAGMLDLPLGTLTVARDPAAAFEVATLNWVGNNTVASFNNRIGRVTLNQNDIYAALCLDSAIASQNYVIQSINAGIGDLITTHPFVFCWNGRTGNVFLTLSDITTVFFQPGQQPISPTPPITSNDDSIATTQWVTEFLTNELEGGGQILATQPWVLANTVNSFNGRQGAVILTLADVVDVGAAPLNAPNFSGVPTAPTAAQGQATGQIATTAFVQQAIAHNTAGVSTFNTRTGDVVLSNADIVAAGAIANPSPNLTGSPTAPTATPGTSTPQIANTQFVMTALAGQVQSFNTRTGAVTLTTADITGAGGAPIVSPAFSSVPTAPTAAPGTNTVQLATCAFVTAALNAAGGVSSFNGRTGVVDLIGNDISAAGGLVNPSVNLTGIPTAPTATAGTNSQQIATTAFVTTSLQSGLVQSFNTRTGVVTLTGADISAAGGALLAGPNFTGVPTAPTAPANTNNTQLATTQFVMAAILADTTGVTSFNTRTGAVSLTTADITGAGGAPAASPAFTGIPAGPTAAPGTNTTQLATTGFVAAALAASGVSSFNSRTGAVTLIGNDVSSAGGALLASPTFTGTPAAPTAAPGTNTTQLASTAFVAAAIAAINLGVTSFNSRQGAVTLTTADITGAGGAPLASPAFTGTPALPTGTTGITQTAGTSNTSLATTAFVATSYAPLASPALTGVPTAPTAGGTINTTQLATTAFSRSMLTARATNTPATMTDPAGTTVAAPGVMCGFALTLTPQISGRVLACITGTAGNSVANSGGAMSLRYGTGAAPAAGVAATGTVAATAFVFGIGAAGAQVPFTMFRVITGLTVGTVYWFDLSQNTNPAGGTFNANTFSGSLVEL